MKIGIILLNTLFFAIGGYALPKHDVVWIESSKVTPWGTFGPKEFCPFNSFVIGMALKMDPKNSNDNTALNAIRLICLDGEDYANITSATGRFGQYGKSKYCPSGFGTGFQLRSEPCQGFYRDDAAAVDFELLCTSVNGTQSRVAYEDNEFLSWVNWIQQQHCPSEFAACGITTQIDDLGDNLKKEDETALNNVNMACCPLSEPIKTCQLNYSWKTMVACYDGAIVCEPKLSVGLADTEQIFRFREFYSEARKNFDDFVMETLKAKAKHVPEKINNRSMRRILKRIKTNQTKSSFKVQCEDTIQQLVVTCGFIKLYTYEHRCVPDESADDKWSAKGLYFRPASNRLETIFWSYNCDFTGDDVANEPSDIADCGDIFLANVKCTHFVWNKVDGAGMCWMKGTGTLPLPNPVERYNEGFFCGWKEIPSN